MDKQAKKRRFDPFEAFAVAESSSRGTPTKATNARSISSAQWHVLPPGFQGSPQPNRAWQDVQGFHAEAGPSKPAQKPMFQAPLYGLPGLVPASPLQRAGMPLKPDRDTSTPSKPLASLSSASPFPFHSHLGTPARPSSSTPLRPLFTLRPDSPFASNVKPAGDEADSKPLKRLMELKPVFGGKGAVEDIEDEENEDDEGMDIDDMENDPVDDKGKVKMAVKVEESPSKPGPAVRDGEASLASRLRRLVARQEASLSLFQTNLRLSQSKSAGSTSYDAKPNGKRGLDPKTTGLSATAPIVSLDSANTVIELLEVVLPVQHGVPLFRAKLIRSDDPSLYHSTGVTSHKLSADRPASKSDNPFLSTGPIHAKVDNAQDCKPCLDIIVSFLPHASSAPASISSKPLGMDPRNVADGMKAFQVARAGGGTVAERKVLRVGVWKPFYVVPLGGQAADQSPGADGEGAAAADQGLAKNGSIVLCSRYIIMEAG